MDLNLRGMPLAPIFRWPSGANHSSFLEAADFRAAGGPGGMKEDDKEPAVASFAFSISPKAFAFFIGPFRLAHDGRGSVALERILLSALLA